VESKENLGFAGGNNLGYSHCHGEFVFLLNNDTKAEPTCVEKLLEAFEVIPNLGSVQSKLILLNTPERLDVCGSYWTDSSFLYHFGYNKDADAPEFNKSLPFFTNKGASMMMRRALIEKLGLFDDDFWCYYEETDLCHRMWLSGYECWYYPEAVVFHAMGGTSTLFANGFIQFHNFKNKLCSFLKNFSWFSLIYILPVYTAVNVLIAIFWFCTGKAANAGALFKAFGWNIRHFPETMRKRAAVQAQRTKSDRQIMKVCKKNPSFNYYVRLLTNTL
jgi:GT2 family glycosyltransferase